MTDRLVSAEKLSLNPSAYELVCRQYVERVYRTLAALEPLYEAPEAIEWLNSQQRALGNGVPARLLGLQGGTAQVEAAISRVLDGAFS